MALMLILAHASMLRSKLRGIQPEEIDEHDRMAWQKANDYGCRSLVETAFGRYKSIIGDSLNAHDDGAQVTEVAIGIKTLNRMIRAAKPISVRA